MQEGRGKRRFLLFSGGKKGSERKNYHDKNLSEQKGVQLDGEKGGTSFPSLNETIVSRGGGGRRKALCRVIGKKGGWINIYILLPTEGVFVLVKNEVEHCTAERKTGLRDRGRL